MHRLLCYISGSFSVFQVTKALRKINFKACSAMFGSPSISHFLLGEFTFPSTVSIVVSSSFFSSNHLSSLKDCSNLKGWVFLTLVFRGLLLIEKIVTMKRWRPSYGTRNHQYLQDLLLTSWKVP